VIFSFQRAPGSPDSPPDEVVEILSEATLQAEKLGLQIAVEVERGFWADTGAHTLDLVRRINRPGFGINWDPGNAFEAGDIPYPDGYSAVRPYVRHVHFKDARRGNRGECVYALDGEIDWPGQIKALARDDYRGFISIETHLRPRIRSAEASLKRLRGLLEIRDK
jgi:sugar phosphate isomerase/epimerase